MSLQDWGAIGELLGGVAIIVSLLYVGLQISCLQRICPGFSITVLNLQSDV